MQSNMHDTIGGWKMKIKKALILVFVIAFFTLVISQSALAAGTVELKTEKEFTTQARVIGFDDIDFGEKVAYHYWESHGVRFVDNGEITPILINSYNRGGDGTVSEPYSISADGDWPSTSANEPLEMKFKRGQKRVGMYIGNGNGELKAKLTAYDKYGSFIGRVSETGFGNKPNTFIGIETTSEPIYSVKLDYGNTLISEEIDDLFFEAFEGTENGYDEAGIVCYSTTSMQEGEVRSFQVGSDTYVITVGSIGEFRGMPYVDFSVSVSKGDLNEGRFLVKSFSVKGGSTYKGFEDSDVELFVDDILIQDYAGGIKSVNFCMNGQAPREVEFTAPMIVEPEDPIVNEDENLPLVIGKKKIAVIPMYKRVPSTVTEGAWSPDYLDKEIIVEMVNFDTGRVLDRQATEQKYRHYEAYFDMPSGKRIYFRAKHDGQLFGGKTTPQYSCREQYFYLNPKTLKVERYLGDHNLLSTSVGTDLKKEYSVDLRLNNCEKPATPGVYDQPPNYNKDVREDRRTTTPVVRVEEPECNGCQPNGVCLPFGTRLIHEGKPSYCAIDSKLKSQIDLGESCQNNYECSSNQCSNGECIDLSGQIQETQDILEKIVYWIRGLFGRNGVR